MAEVAGLDSYNAHNVITSLATLAKNYNRTVIFTIHQPQSNIVNLFDRLLLLAKGQLVYNGDAKKAHHHFEKQGHRCPEGYNIADYLIDLTVDAAGDGQAKRSNGHVTATGRGRSSELDIETGRRERRGLTTDSDSDSSGSEEDDTPTGFAGIKAKAARLLGFSPASSGTATPTGPEAVPQKLASLVLANRATDDTKILEAEIARIQSGSTPDGIDPILSDGLGRDVRGVQDIKGFKKASWGRQFMLLSGRAFKNLYRSVDLPLEVDMRS